jgi:hypothetical protein
MNNTHGRRTMNLSSIQPRDWMIAVAAFLAGAWIF